MTNKHRELLYSIAAGWSFAFILGFFLWWTAVQYVKPGQEGAYVFIFLFLGAGAVTGAGYIFWWLGKDDTEDRK